MIGCKKFNEELHEPYNKCLGCKFVHKHMPNFGDTYPNHNGETVPNCLWVDHKFRKKGG